MLIISQGDTRIGQVLCMYRSGEPIPDLNAEESPYVKRLPAGLNTRFYPCDKTGCVVNETNIPGALLRSPIPVADDVLFIPVVQLHWDDVVARTSEDFEGGGGYVVYNPAGGLLKRLVRRDVHIAQPDGSIKRGDDYACLYYKPGRHAFTMRMKPVQEDPQAILQAFAQESACEVAALVFVPSK